ncbi:NADH dehydrogenase [ubiquinone] 1 alpha subcomplex subunit 4-like 2 [Hydractinia symbiolongicarpus]|uniref:NADH dehydrogenase [ubiquinone] 1 alpha subcomplex subunit 4-like 2 n=1 Tax=Hydractinia symbiolongicarpus TaxID=13093 RepID=UPI00254E4378|nr:NADH dehydrogenase [ubiquinone] 1 alpha subcomplex subunit 4-like 2 [Hydractinia symbiolongicarpus]
MNIFTKFIGHYEVYPLLGAVCVGASVGVAGLVKACFYRDVVWNHKSNPEPWLNVKQTENTKWYKTSDYFKDRKELPKIY